MSTRSTMEVIAWTLAQLTRPSTQTGDPGGWRGYGIAELAYDGESGGNVVSHAIPLDYQDDDELVVELATSLLAAYKKRPAQPPQGEQGKGRGHLAHGLSQV